MNFSAVMKCAVMKCAVMKCAVMNLTPRSGTIEGLGPTAGSPKVCSTEPWGSMKSFRGSTRRSEKFRNQILYCEKNKNTNKLCQIYLFI